MRIARSSCVLRPCDSYRWLLAVLAIAAALALNACGRSDAQSYAGGKQLVILGIDGMDPGFLGRHWDQLPNLARLRNEGDFRPLATVMPPQSPVVWSTFITGTDPGDTGIYDFIHRHPDTLSLYSSMAQTVERGSTLPVGPYRLPLSSGAVRNLRHGTPFWKILSDHGVPVTILRMPTNFPPVDAGLATAGMGDARSAGHVRHIHLLYRRSGTKEPSGFRRRYRARASRSSRPPRSSGFPVPRTVFAWTNRRPAS